jgi:hypothetical protein
VWPFERGTAVGRGGAGGGAVMAIATLAAIGAACGGGGSALSPSAFDRGAGAECTKLERAGEELNRAQDATASGGQVRTFVSRAADVLRARLSAIDDLVPPDDIADDVARFISTLEEYADGLERLGNRTQAGQSFADVQRANPERVQELNGLADRANGLAVRLGLTECLSGAA